jgi:hypothetical protein
LRSAEIAYKRGDGRKFDLREVLVDKELSRIDKYWLPKRLGGGKGGIKRKNREEDEWVKELRKEIKENYKE